MPFLEKIIFPTSLALFTFGVFISPHSYSATVNTEATTKHGYNPNSFCQNGSGFLMEPLNKRNANKIEKLEELRKKIDDENAYLAIISAMSAAKNQYTEGLQNMASKKAPPSSLNAVDEMKKIIKSGLTLSAIGMLLKDENLPSHFVMTPSLEKTLADFKASYKKVLPENKTRLKKDVDEIINSIPEDISPEVIFNILEHSSPNMMRILSQDISKEVITSCLAALPSSEKACQQLMAEPEKTKIFIQKLAKETEAATNGLENFSTIITTNTSKNIERFNALLQQTPPTDLDDKVLAWKEKCLKPKEDDLAICQEKMRELAPHLDLLKSNYKGRLEALQNEIKAINSSKDFDEFETLKEYILKKYLRTCGNDKKFKIQKNDVKLSLHYDGVSYCGVQQLSTLDILEGDVNEVLKRTKLTHAIDPRKNSHLVFDENEIQKFLATCASLEKNAPSPNVNEICSLVKSEKTVTKIKVNEELEKRKWRELNDKYWITNDPTSPRGYTQVEKKSNLRIFGEGFLPVVPTLLPLWFADIQTTQNIRFLTDQAIYQKQVLFAYDIYNTSPWLFNSNIFNPASIGTLGTPLTTTTSGITPGFNFGQ